jgi:hypothetical protein
VQQHISIYKVAVFWDVGPTTLLRTSFEILTVAQQELKSY